MAIHPSLLQQFHLLKHLPESKQRQLAAASALGSYARREVLVEKNDPLKLMGFLLEGRLQLVDFTLDGKEVGLSFIDEGHYYGEVAMLDGLRHPEYVLANRKSQVVLVPAEMLRSFLFEEPRIAEVVMLSLARKLRQHSAQRQILSISNPLQRVCAQLLLLLEHAEAYDAQPAQTPQGESGRRSALKPEDAYRVLAVAPTHQDLAMMINLSRETVTRVFQVLQSRNLLERQGDAMLIRLREVEQMARHGD